MKTPSESVDDARARKQRAREELSTVASGATFDDLLEAFAAVADEVASKLWELNRSEDAGKWDQRVVELLDIARGTPNHG